MKKNYLNLRDSKSILAILIIGLFLISPIYFAQEINKHTRLINSDGKSIFINHSTVLAPVYIESIDPLNKNHKTTENLTDNTGVTNINEHNEIAEYLEIEIIATSYLVENELLALSAYVVGYYNEFGTSSCNYFLFEENLAFSSNGEKRLYSKDFIRKNWIDSQKSITNVISEESILELVSIHDYPKNDISSTEGLVNYYYQMIYSLERDAPDEWNNKNNINYT